MSFSCMKELRPLQALVPVDTAAEMVILVPAVVFLPSCVGMRPAEH